MAVVGTVGAKKVEKRSKNDNNSNDDTIEKVTSYLANQLKNHGSDAHIHGLGVFSFVGWFEMDGFCGCLCSESVVCSSRAWI